MKKKSGGKTQSGFPFRTGSSSGGKTGQPGTSNVTGSGGKASKGGKIMGRVKPKHS